MIVCVRKIAYVGLYWGGVWLNSRRMQLWLPTFPLGLGSQLRKII